MTEQEKSDLLKLLESFVSEIIIKTTTPIIEKAVNDGVTKILRSQSQKEFLSIKEVCEKLGVSAPKVHSLFNQGLLDRVKIPGSRNTLVKSAQLEEAMKVIRPYKRPS